VLVGTRNQNRMTSVLPHRPFQCGMSRRKSSSRTLAVYPDLTELGMPFLLDKIVRDLVDQLQLAAEHFFESFGNLFEDDQPVDDGKVSSGGPGVQVAAIVLRLRREITEVEVDYDFRLFGARKLEVVGCQPVTPSARAGVSLQEQCACFFASLKLYEMVSAT